MKTTRTTTSTVTTDIPAGSKIILLSWLDPDIAAVAEMCAVDITSIPVRKICNNFFFCYQIISLNMCKYITGTRDCYHQSITVWFHQILVQAKPSRLVADKLVYFSITLRSPYQNIHKNSNFINVYFNFTLRILCHYLSHITRDEGHCIVCLYIW